MTTGVDDLMMAREGHTWDRLSDMQAKITIQADSPKAGQGLEHVCCTTEQAHHQSKGFQLAVSKQRGMTPTSLCHTMTGGLALTCQTYCMDLPPVTQ